MTNLTQLDGYKKVVDLVDRRLVKYLFVIDGDNHEYRINDLMLFYDFKAKNHNFHVVLFYEDKTKLRTSRFNALKCCTLIGLEEKNVKSDYILQFKKLKNSVRNIVMIYDVKGVSGRVYVTGNRITRIRKYSVFSSFICHNKKYLSVNGVLKDRIVMFNRMIYDMNVFEVWSDTFVKALNERLGGTFSVNENTTLDEIKPSLVLLGLLVDYCRFMSLKHEEMHSFIAKYNLNDKYVLKWLTTGNFYHMTNCIRMELTTMGPNVIKILRNIVIDSRKYRCGDGIYQVGTNDSIYFYLYEKVDDSYIRMDSSTLYEAVDVLINLQKSLNCISDTVEFKFMRMPTEDVVDISFTNWRTISRRI